MKMRTATLTSSLLLLVLGIAMVSGMPSGRAMTQESHGGKIEGTWRVQVSRRDCQTGAVQQTFPAMLTFGQGGTLTGTSTVLPVALRGPDHGIWSHNGGQSYRAVSEAFIFNPAGAWTTTQRINQEIELSANSDTFYSNATTEFFNAAGVSIATGCATAIATRME
jgi:hypothetical protein